jgi:hypothetical protein
MISLRLIPPGEINAILLVVTLGLAGESDAILLVVTPGLAGERGAEFIFTPWLDVTFGSTAMFDGSTSMVEASTALDLVFLQGTSRISEGRYCITYKAWNINISSMHELLLFLSFWLRWWKLLF